MEDGLRSHILNCNELNKHELLHRIEEKHKQYRGNGRLRLSEGDDFTAFRSSALTVLILDCIVTSLKNITSYNFKSVEDVLANNNRIVSVSSKLASAWDNFYDTWLRDYMFKHEDVTACTVKAEGIVSDLFNVYVANQNLIPSKYRDHSEKVYGSIGISNSELLKPIIARNYVAGMTDAYATTQHVRLFMSSERAV
jgi:dGTPase